MEPEKVEPVKHDLDVLDMPKTWCEPPLITSELYRTPLAKFSRRIQYKDCLIEKWAQYEAKMQGLVCRVTAYQSVDHYEKKIVESVHEYYMHREDKLEKRETTVDPKRDIEQFGKGYEELQGLKEYIKTPTKKVYNFHPTLRNDGLTQRVTINGKTDETFAMRDDRMISREVRFKKLQKNVKKSYVITNETQNTSWYLTQITEVFSRDKSVPASKDILSRVYFVGGKREIQLNFHFAEGEIMPKCLVYDMSIGQQKLDIKHTHHKCKKEDLPSRNQQLKDLTKLAMLEKSILSDIREREKQFGELDASLVHRSHTVKLEKDIHDAVKEQMVDTEEKDVVEDVYVRAKVDYLKPFVEHFPDGRPRSRQHAIQAKTECLAALKARLLARANIIQDHLDREQEKLKSRNNQYMRTQTEDPEEKKAIDEAFQKFSEDTMFRLSILDGRLKRHEKLAIKMYTDLDRQLRKDPRLRLMHSNQKR